MPLKAVRCGGEGGAQGQEQRYWGTGGHSRGCLGHTRLLRVSKRRQNTAQERGCPRSPPPTLQVPGGARPPPPPTPPHHRSGPGFNHPSITPCLLLSTAHLLALVKHAVNSEKNSPALPEQGNGQEGAGQAPPAARSQHRSQRCREGLGQDRPMLAPSAATGATPALKVLRIHHLPWETRGAPVLDSHGPKSAPQSVHRSLA